MPADDDDDRPRKRPWNKKGRDDDDDDRPRRRRDEEEDEDRPRKRRRDEDDEEDDRPRRRRRDEDDDDDYEHDRPRRGKSEGGSNGLATAGLIMGLLSFCTAGLSGIPGGICSAIALGKPTGRGMAIGGLVSSGLGILLWIALGYGFYTVGKSAGTRIENINNMKQIGIAFHSDHDVNWGMSGPYARGPMGNTNTGLSFRVGLLPYLEQNALHKQFDMSQSWNSPKNQAASNTKLKVFTAPPGEPSVNTPYRVFYGGGALFNEDGKAVRLTDVTDGTSNTIMAVHATEQVQWAEPREFKYSDTTPVPSLGEPGAKTLTILMADGSVRLVSPKVSESTLRLAIKRADGMLLPADW